MKKWKSKRILITGGSGMLGYSLISVLNSIGLKPTVLSRGNTLESQNYDIIRGNIEDQEHLRRLLTEHSFDVIFHLAAQRQVGDLSPMGTFYPNIVGTMNLLEVIRLHHSSAIIITTSSAAVKPFFYENSTSHNRNVNQNRAKLRPYAASKICAEMLCRCYYDTYGIKVGVARLTNLYGPADRNMGRLIPSTIRSILQQQPPIIRSNPQNLINCLFVDDAAQALLLLAESMEKKSLEGEVIDICGNQEYSLQTLVDLILQRMDRVDLRPVLSGNAPLVKTVMNEPSPLLVDQLGWKEKTSLAIGLDKAIQWYRENIIQ